MPASFSSTTGIPLRYMLGTDLISDIDEGFKVLAEDCATKLTGYSQGTHAARPAAGVPNRFYKETDTGLLVHDTGAGWEALALYGEGTHAERPTAGIRSRLYKETDTGLIFHDTGTAWEQLLRPGDQAFPLSYGTGAILAGNKIEGSEHTVALRNGALIEWRAMVRFLGSSDQGVVCNLWKDGAIVDEENIHGESHSVAPAILHHVINDALSHAYEVQMASYGTNQSFALTQGIIVLGP